MNSDQVRKAISKLKQGNGKRESKYKRNLTLYTDTPITSLDNVDSSTIGYFETGTGETSFARENIIFATITALVAKIAEHAKARPFINTINGSFRDMQVSKAAQQYFDIAFDEHNVYHTVAEAFRNACIFDTGCVFVNPKTQEISNVYPWQLCYDSAELRYGKPVQVAYIRKRFPVTLLDDKFKLEITNQYVTLVEYWNVREHIHAMLVNEDTSKGAYIEEEYAPDVLPFISITYDEAIAGGNTSTSVCDALYGIQSNVNALLTKISRAIAINPGNTILVPTSGTIKTDAITNETGSIIPYTPVNGVSQPITSLTPPLVDPQLTQMLDSFKNDAYELVGISQMSVAGQKPAGLDSGAALRTMENIEADRFQTQLNKVIHLYVDIAKLCVEVFDPNKSILPDTRQRINIKWKDVASIRNRMSIQFSAAENLSKDPAVKLQQLQQLSQAGVIPASRIPSLLDMPDLEQGYSFANNSFNAVMTLIDACITEKDFNYQIPEFLSLEQLKPELLNQIMALYSHDENNTEDIAKLEKLYAVCLEREQAVGNAAQADEANVALDTEANNMDYDAMQMDMQAEQMTTIANDLQNGVITPDTAQAMLQQFSAINFDIGMP